MKTKPLVILFGALSPLVWAADINALTLMETASGWGLLFDGRLFDGWRASDPAFGLSAEVGGVLLLNMAGHGKAEQEGFRGGDVIVSVEEVRVKTVVDLLKILGAAPAGMVTRFMWCFLVVAVYGLTRSRLSRAQGLRGLSTMHAH